MRAPIGLLGVATYLPPETRPNSWWSSAIVDRWVAARATAPPPPSGVPVAERPREMTDAMTRVLVAMAQQAFDPFHGVKSRHVMPQDMAASDMEREAAERVIAHVAARTPGFARDHIDVLFVHTAVPDYLLSNTACVLHDALGLPARCLAFEVAASSHSFLAQLTLAEQMIASGRARYVLIVQSCALSRVLDTDDPLAPMFGDGAAAAIIGPVAGGGVLANVQRTQGRYPRALIASVPDRRWYDAGRDAGRVILHSADPVGARQVFLQTADFAIEVVGEALREAALAAADVDFFAVHQGTPWLRKVAHDVLGLTRARSIDTFETTGYLFGVSIPLVLETAQRRGMLARGDRVVLYGGGGGVTFGAIALGWGDPVA